MNTGPRRCNSSAAPRERRGVVELQQRARSPRRAPCRSGRTGPRPAAAELPDVSYTPFSNTKWKRFGGAAPAIVTSEPSCISRLPSPSTMITLRSGRARAMPSAMVEALPMQPTMSRWSGISLAGSGTAARQAPMACSVVDGQRVAACRRPARPSLQLSARRLTRRSADEHDARAAVLEAVAIRLSDRPAGRRDSRSENTRRPTCRASARSGARRGRRCHAPCEFTSRPK